MNYLLTNELSYSELVLRLTPAEIPSMLDVLDGIEDQFPEVDAEEMIYELEECYENGNVAFLAFEQREGIAVGVKVMENFLKMPSAIISSNVEDAVNTLNKLKELASSITMH